MGKRTGVSTEDRFWEKVDATGGCWNWTAGTDSSGYGTFNAGKEWGTVSAHRFAWQILVGPIPDGLELDHRCFNTRCVDPDHLEPVTHQQNVDRSRRSRLYCVRGHRRSENRIATGGKGCHSCTRKTPAGAVVQRKPPRIPTQRQPVTHCKNGHEYTTENTYVQTKAGGRESRQCRKCKVANQRRYEAGKVDRL